MQNFLCWQCQEPGHKKRDCPQSTRKAATDKSQAEDNTAEYNNLPNPDTRGRHKSPDQSSDGNFALDDDEKDFLSLDGADDSAFGHGLIAVTGPRYVGKLLNLAGFFLLTRSPLCSFP